MNYANNLKSTHDYARAYTAKGVSVISLKPKSKQPSIPSWKPFTVSTASKEQLENWFIKYRQQHSNNHRKNIFCFCYRY